MRRSLHRFDRRFVLPPALIALLAYGLSESEPDRQWRIAGSGETQSRASAELPRLSGVGAETSRTIGVGWVLNFWACCVALSRGVRCFSAGIDAWRGGRGTVVGVDVQDVTDDAREFISEYGSAIRCSATARVSRARPSRSSASGDLRARPPRANRAVRRGPVDERFMRERVLPLLRGEGMRRLARSGPGPALVVGAGRRLGSELPPDHLDESRTRSCAYLRHAAGPRHRGAAGSAPAGVHRASDRRCRSKDEIKQALVAQLGRACSPCPVMATRMGWATCWCTWSPHSASCSRWAPSRLPWCAGADESRCRRRPAPHPSPGASTTTWSATTCDRCKHRRRHGVRRVRRRLHLVRVACGCAVPAIVAVWACRSRTSGRRRRMKVSARAAVLPRLHRPVVALGMSPPASDRAQDHALCCADTARIA